MDSIKQFREYTRQLECHLSYMNQSDCCCCGVSQTQCFLIVEIGRKPGISVKELAEILRMDKSAISRSVEELVQKGFVERNPSKEDRRYVELRLLQKGQERFEKIEHDMYLKFKDVWERIPEEKRGQVLESLQLYNEACMVAEKM
ncbi:MAG: MarR family transcriptional regulator [Lachnospiraceae bacterium]|nr:MarR family transcriptional regulator [Lachnospiraceae bacterium]